jgi:CheY-like chemotaxis protein
MIDALAKLIESIAHLIGVLAWPVVAILLARRFGQPIREFLANLGEGSFKVLGVEASGKRRAEAAAAIATATVAQLEAKSAEDHNAPPSRQEISSLISRSLEEANNIITSTAIREARGRTILWVDDQPEKNLYETNALKALGFDVWSASSTEEALQLFRHAKYADIIISDMRRPEGDQAGYDLLDHLSKENIYKPFIIYSGYSTPDQKAEAKRRGAFGSTSDAGRLIALVLEALKYGNVFD